MAQATIRQDPEIGLRAVAALRGLVEVLEAVQVDDARTKGWSWRDIASRLGVSKQAVQQKHGRKAAQGRGGSQMVRVTEPAGIVSHLGSQEAERLQHRYLGPEHLLLGLLLQDDNRAAHVLRGHSLELEAVRAEVNRLIAQRVLSGPQPSDAELLATLGLDLEALQRRFKETFGKWAYYTAAQQVRLRRRQIVTHTPGSGAPMLCVRALRFASHEAVVRNQEIGPEHLLLGLLRDAEDPVGTDLNAQQRRERAYLGLPDHGPHPIRLLVEARGLTIEALREAIRSELDSNR